MVEEVQDVIFKRPLATFQQKQKEIDFGAGVENFKSLRCEIRNEEEKEQVEDMVVFKLGKWKYSQTILHSGFPMN